MGPFFIWRRGRDDSQSPTRLLTPAGRRLRRRAFAKRCFARSNRRVEPRPPASPYKKGPLVGPFFIWRRGRDSNPRYGNPYGSLAGNWFQPLTHLSETRQLVVVGALHHRFQCPGRGGSFHRSNPRYGNPYGSCSLQETGNWLQPLTHLSGTGQIMCRPKRHAPRDIRHAAHDSK